MDPEREVKAGGRGGVASEEGEKGRRKIGCRAEDVAQLIERLLKGVQKSGFKPQYRIQLGELIQACNPKTCDVEAGGSGVQDHP